MLINFPQHPLGVKWGLLADPGCINILENPQLQRLCRGSRELGKILMYYLDLYRQKQLEEQKISGILLILGKIMKLWESQAEKKRKWENPDYLLKVLIKFKQYFPKILESDLQRLLKKFSTKIPKVNEFEDQTKQWFVYQSHKLLCCTQYYQKGVYLNRQLNTHNFFFCKDDFSMFSKERSLLLSQYICSVCNNGGGVLHFGFQKFQKNFLPSGITSHNCLNLNKIQNFINESKNIVKPCFQLNIQRVPLKDNNVSDPKVQGVCLRVKITPISRKQIFYLESGQNIEAKTKWYSIYNFDEQQEPKKLAFENNRFYELIIKKFYHRQNKVADLHHSKIKCFKPQYFDYNPEIFPNIDKIFSENNKFHQTLLIVQSEEDNRSIQNFIDYLSLKKVKFAIKRPYPDLKPTIPRQIWLLSHKLNFAGIKNVLKNFEYQNVGNGKKMTIMPVYKNIEIEQKKLSIKNQKLIEQQIKKRFKTPYQVNYYSIIDKNTETEKNMVQFVFQSESQSLFTYLICQSMYLRPYFTKNGNIFKIEEQKEKKEKKLYEYQKLQK